MRVATLEQHVYRSRSLLPNYVSWALSTHISFIEVRVSRCMIAQAQPKAIA
jgi:hypothetical protein